MRYVVVRLSDGKFYRGREYSFWGDQRWGTELNQAFIFLKPQPRRWPADKYKVLTVEVRVV